MNFISLNDQLLPASTPVFTASNRGFRYGDGCFETILVRKGEFPMWSLHMERLFLSLQLLQMQTALTTTDLNELGTKLLSENQCVEGRMRLSFFREEDGSSSCLIETSSLPAAYSSWDNEGYTIGIFPYGRKSCDVFSNIKSASYLPYVMAERYARQHGLDECLVLNTQHHLCDATRANLFLVKGDEVFTPALHQGCVNGVMRRYLIDLIKKSGWHVHQEALSEDDLKQADEVFLTNALMGIRQVKSYKDITYTSSLAEQLYQQLQATIFS